VSTETGDALPAQPEYEPIRPRARSLDDIVGLDEVKEELRTQIELWAHAERLAELGGVPRIGFIFCGPPGSGKTTTGHALAAVTGRELYGFSGTDFYGPFGQERLGTMLEHLATRPVIVLIDEADDLLHARTFTSDEYAQAMVRYLLVGLDRTTHDVAAFFVLTTNMPPHLIDPALCHAGRLGRPLIFRPLDGEERVTLLRHHAKAYTVAEDVDLEQIAVRLAAVPTADLAHVYDEAAAVAWRAGHSEITQQDLQEAVTRFAAGLARKKQPDDAEIRRTAVHEAGHALVRLVQVGRWDAVGFVQVSARTEGQLGATEYDDFDVETHTPDEVRSIIAEGLAGREAERIVLGSISSGAAADLQRINSLANRAAADWGLSSRGARTYYGEYPPDSIARRIEDAAIELIQEGESRAAVILTEHDEALRRLADRLFEHRFADTRTLEDWLSGLIVLGGSR
jgi:cell division protease FtsH